MAELDAILNPGKEEPAATAAPAEQETPDQEAEAVEQEDTGEEEATQVAAESESNETAPTPAQVKSELAALAKERERIRQKEAALDDERSKLAEQQEAAASNVIQPTAELRELRKQHREALTQLMLEPDDETTQQKIDELEDRMEAVRMSMITESQKSQTKQEKAESAYKEVYSEVHDKYPFLDTEHPQFSMDLNQDINAMYYGSLQMGVPADQALKKAVEKFAPAYAKQLEPQQKQTSTEPPPQRQKEAVNRDKLSKTGFSEVRSMGRRDAKGMFTGPTPLTAVLNKPT